jgi:DMSO reductase iron-sulfur subunit
MAKQFGMVIDMSVCIGCQACTIACKFENGTDLDIDWHRVLTVGDPKAKIGQDIPAGVYPDLSLSWLPMPCMHCGNPPCKNVCPAAAITKSEEGFVLVDQTRCVGCQYCSWACPYGVPQFSSTTGKMQKCTLCVQRVTKGQVPACVNACVYGARVFGDVNDPHSDVSKVIARKHAQVLLPEQGTKPSIYYVKA